MSREGRQDGNGGGTHRCVGPIETATKPPFIFPSLLILFDGFQGVHVLVIHPFIITIQIPLPLDQVLTLLLSSIVAFVQDRLDFVLLLSLN